jgi:phosphohistidine phosphatase SixA
MVIRLLLVLCLLFPFAAAQAEEGPWALLKQDGAVILFRHANAPGTGDPEGFVLGDCSTQRNLDEKGRAEARAIGEAFRSQGIKVGRVLSSQWCRSRETADLAFPGRVTEEPAFNSFFDDRSAEPQATAAARDILARWMGQGTLVVVTHQVNITALTGITPRPGEGVVVAMQDGTVEVLGRLPPPSLP